MLQLTSSRTNLVFCSRSWYAQNRENDRRLCSLLVVMRRLTPLPRRTGCTMSKLTHQWQHQTGDEVGYPRLSKSSFPLKRQDKKSGLALLEIRTILVQFRGSNNVDGKTRHRNAHKQKTYKLQHLPVVYRPDAPPMPTNNVKALKSQGIFIRSSKRQTDHKQVVSKVPFVTKVHLKS